MLCWPESCNGQMENIDMKNKAKWKCFVYLISAVFLMAVCFSFSVFAAQEHDCTQGKHKYAEIERVPATETTEGEVLYRCELCGKEWTDIIAAAGHIWGEWAIDKFPSCSASGERHRICTRSSSHIQYESIPALGHDYREQMTKEPSCMEAGENSFICAHDPTHRYSEPIPALGHDYREQMTQKPSCLTAGENSFICTHDPAHGYSESIPALGHDFEEWFVQSPAGEGVSGVEMRICAHDVNHKEMRELTALPLRPLEPTPEQVMTFNRLDIVIGSVNVGLLSLLGGLIYPYVKWSKYIKKRRKYVQKAKGLRKMVSQRYDFI